MQPCASSRTCDLQGGFHSLQSKHAPGHLALQCGAHRVQQSFVRRRYPQMLALVHVLPEPAAHCLRQVVGAAHPIQCIHRCAEFVILGVGGDDDGSYGRNHICKRWALLVCYLLVFIRPDFGVVQHALPYR